MSTPTMPLHIWIFNDASVADLLAPGSPLWGKTVPSLIAEVAERPTLAHTLDLETPATYPGMAGLLGRTTKPADLVVKLPGTQLPAILAPAQMLTPAVWAAAIRRLATDTRIDGPRLLLVDAALLPSLVSVLVRAQRIGLVWDLSTPPGDDLGQLLEGLTTEGLLSSTQWAGLLGYFSADHGMHPEEARAAELSLHSLPGARMLSALSA